MGKKWFLIGGAAIVVVAAVLYAGLVYYPEAQFRTALREGEAFLPPGVSFAYKSADYSVFSDRATLTGVTLRGTGPLGLEVTSEKVTLDRPSFTLGSDWQRAAAKPKTLAPDMAIPVATAMSLSGIVVRTQNLSEKIASAHVDGLRLYPWALLHPGVPSLAQALAVLKTEPPPKSLSPLAPLLRFEAALVLGVSYTGVKASTITATGQIPATRGLPAHAVTESIASVVGPANDRGIFGAGSAEHMVMQLGPPAGTMTIDRIAVSGLNVRQPLERILAGSALKPAILDGLAIGRIELAGMTIKPPSHAAVTLGTLTLSRIAVFHGLPVSAALAWDGIRVTRAEMLTPRARLVFDQLGLDTMTVSVDAAYNWELAAGRVALQGIRLQVTELGSLNLSASLVGVTTPAPDALDRVRLAHAVLRYQDASLVERAINRAAAATHADPAAFRQQMIAMVRARTDEFADSPALAEAAKAIIAFLQAPHSLTIELSPPSPVLLASLRTASSMTSPDLASLLGLRVTANQ